MEQSAVRKNGRPWQEIRERENTEDSSLKTNWELLLAVRTWEPQWKDSAKRRPQILSRLVFFFLEQSWVSSTPVSFYYCLWLLCGDLLSLPVLSIVRHLDRKRKKISLVGTQHKKTLQGFIGVCRGCARYEMVPWMPIVQMINTHWWYYSLLPYLHFAALYSFTFNWWLHTSYFTSQGAVCFFLWRCQEWLLSSSFGLDSVWGGGWFRIRLDYPISFSLLVIGSLY